MNHIRLDLPEVNGRFAWLPLVYVSLVPSLMFLTNIGERVYQDVFFMGLLIYAISRRQADWSPHVVWIWAAWLSYVIWSTLADYLGSGHLTMDWFRGAALLMLLPWLVVWARGEKERWALSFGLRLALLIGAAVAMIQVYGFDVPRAHGSENPNIFALFMLMYGVFAIHESLRAGSRFTPVWVLLAFVPLLLSGSRTALLALAVVVVVMLWIHRRQLRSRKMVAGLSVAAVAAALVGLPQVVERSQLFVGDLSADGAEFGTLWRGFVEMDFVTSSGGTGQEGPALKPEFKTSFGYRLVYWRTGWEVFHSHPWTGVGSEDEMLAVGEKLGLGERLAERHSHVHNTFLQHLVTGGVVKLSLLVIALTIPLVSLWRRGRERWMTVAFVTIGASVAGLTAIVFELHQFVFVYTLILVHALAGQHARQQGAGEKIVNLNRPAAVSSVGRA